MPAAGLLTGTLERSYGGLPTLPLVNLIPEAAITEPTQFALISRPRLQVYAASGFSGVNDTSARIVHYTSNLALASGFTDTFFGLIGTNFYSYNVGLTLGTVPGVTGVPSTAENEIGIVITAGSGAKFWDGTTFRDITFPDGAAVTKVLTTQGRFVFLRSGSQRYYWTEPLSNMLDGSGDIVIDGLNYASAENDPDNLRDGLVWQDHLVLAGKNTIELHGQTGNDNAPWEPALGSTIHRGVIRTGAMAVFNGSFAWIDKDCSVWQYDGSQGARISNAGIEERLRKFPYIRMDSFRFEGREFLHIWSDGNLDPSAYADLFYDAATSQWIEWETDSGPFAGGPAVNVPVPLGVGIDGLSSPVFGGKTHGNLAALSSTTLEGGPNYSESTIEHRFRFGIPVDGNSIAINNALLRCQTYTSGTAVASLRTSRDKGNTWTAYRDRSLVAAGIRNKVEWRGLGTADHPGFLCEVKTANCDEFSVSGAMFNEFVTGRSR